MGTLRAFAQYLPRASKPRIKRYWEWSANHTYQKWFKKPKIIKFSFLKWPSEGGGRTAALKKKWTQTSKSEARAGLELAKSWHKHQKNAYSQKISKIAIDQKSAKPEGDIIQVGSKLAPQTPGRKNLTKNVLLKMCRKCAKMCGKTFQASSREKRCRQNLHETKKKWKNAEDVRKCMKCSNENSAKMSKHVEECAAHPPSSEPPIQCCLVKWTLQKISDLKNSREKFYVTEKFIK